MCPNPQFSANLVTFTEEILHGKLQFLCSLRQLKITPFQVNVSLYFNESCSIVANMRGKLHCNKLLVKLTR